MSRIVKEESPSIHEPYPPSITDVRFPDLFFIQFQSLKKEAMPFLQINWLFVILENRVSVTAHIRMYVCAFELINYLFWAVQ